MPTKQSKSKAAPVHEGYLEQPDSLELKQAIETANGQLIQAHVSGHIRQEDIL